MGRFFIKIEILILILGFVLCSSTTQASKETHYQNGKLVKPSKYIQYLKNLKEDDVNIAKIAFELSKEVDSTVDVAADMKKIKLLADETQKIAGDSQDPKVRIGALNKVIYQQLGLRYDFSDPKAKKAENNLLSLTLKTNKGSCLTMPLMYMAVSQKLNWPLYPVFTPTHLFLRYSAPVRPEVNIEATSGGWSRPDSYYINSFKIDQSSIKNGNYMRTASYKEMVGVLLQFNSDYYFNKENHRKALEYINAAIEIFPKNPNLYMAKGEMLHSLSEQFMNRHDLFTASNLEDHAQEMGLKAQSLGYKRWDDSAYLKQMKELKMAEDVEKGLKPIM